MELEIKQSRRIQIMGNIVTTVGILGLILYYWEKLHLGRPSDFGIVLGNGAIILVGVFGLMASKSLLDIEKRLDRLEPKEM
jgi:hypothetical protein